MTVLELAAIGGIVAIVWAAIVVVFKKTVLNFIGKIPQILLEKLEEKFTVSRLLESGAGGISFHYNTLNTWIREQPFFNIKAKDINLLVVGTFAGAAYYELPSCQFYFRYEGRPMVLIHTSTKIENKDNGGWNNRFRFKLIMLKKDKETLEKFVKNIASPKPMTIEVMQNIHRWDGTDWLEYPKKRRRRMDTVYIDQNIHNGVTHLINGFQKDKELYYNRGIPHRLILLFEGPPGTGKTTYATALAGLYNRTICILSLSEIGDNSLSEAFKNSSDDSIILIEDIDSFSMTHSRIEDPNGPKANIQRNEKNTPTLSGLLNAMDGIAAIEGRLIIMTTNHPELLDEALIRAARVHKRVFIGNLMAEEVDKMYRVFFPEELQWTNQIRNLANSISKPCAWWQQTFLTYDNNKQEMIRYLETQINVYGPQQKDSNGPDSHNLA